MDRMTFRITFMKRYCKGNNSIFEHIHTVRLSCVPYCNETSCLEQNIMYNGMFRLNKYQRLKMLAKCSADK